MAAGYAISARRSRSEFVITETELNAIAPAAMMGLRKPRSPKTGRSTAGTSPAPPLAPPEMLNNHLLYPPRSVRRASSDYGVSLHEDHQTGGVCSDRDHQILCVMVNRLRI